MDENNNYLYRSLQTPATGYKYTVVSIVIGLLKSPLGKLCRIGR